MKIMSIDSPIEYLGSYTQLEYHNAEQLERYVSAIKKQDVDVVALNEIADDYVAEHINNLLQSGSHIATTIHTSSLANIVYKLKSVFGEVGYKELIPYINLIVYQDKFSKPCSHCKTQMGIALYEKDERIYKYLKDNGVTDLFQSVGCEKCNHTKKQSGLKIVAEFLEPNYEDKQQLINMSTHEQHNYINKIIKRPMSGVILENVCSGDLLIGEVINKYGGEV